MKNSIKFNCFEDFENEEKLSLTSRENYIESPSNKVIPNNQLFKNYAKNLDNYTENKTQVKSFDTASSTFMPLTGAKKFETIGNEASSNENK